ncbi:MAG TPA: hypothetical protein VL329_11895 [Nitrospiraceae bacterium]|jgi:hypothetical protein|nr:hypothetical protein [Nitrospiraceae bacterium]
MQKIPEALKSALACAPTQSFTIVVDGRSYRISPDDQPDPKFEAVYALEKFINGVANTMVDLAAGLETLRQAQLEIVKELRKPVVAEYDPKTGRLLSAQRK